MHRHRQVVSNTHQAIGHISHNVFFENRRRSGRVRVLLLPVHVRQLKSSSHTVFSVPARGRLHENGPVLHYSTLGHAVSNIRVDATDRQQVYFRNGTIHLTVIRSLTLLPNQVRLGLISNEVFTNLLVRTIRVLKRRVTRARHTRTPLHTRFLRHLPHFTKAPIRQNKPVRRMRISVVRLRRTGLTIRHLTYTIVPLLKVTRFHHGPRIFTLLAFHRSHVIRHTARTNLVIMPHHTISVAMTNFRHALRCKNGTLVISTRRTRTSLQGRVTIIRYSRKNVRDYRTLSFQELYFEQLFSAILVLIPT